MNESEGKAKQIRYVSGYLAKHHKAAVQGNGMRHCTRTNHAISRTNSCDYKSLNYLNRQYKQQVLNKKCGWLSTTISSWFPKFTLFPVMLAASEVTYQVKQSNGNEIPLMNSEFNAIDENNTTLEEKKVGFEPFRVTDEEVEQHIANETGMMRIKDFFFRKIQNYRHPALTTIEISSLSAAWASFVLHGVRGMAEGEELFKLKNKARVYRNEFDAKRQLTNAKIVGFMKVGCRYGFRTLAFMSIFMGTSFMLSVYNNKSKFSDLVISGCFTGTLLRCHLGLRGITFGFVVGGTLGIITSSIVYPLLVYTNNTHEIRHPQYIKLRLEDDKMMYLEPGEEYYTSKMYNWYKSLNR